VIKQTVSTAAYGPSGPSSSDRKEKPSSSLFTVFRGLWSGARQRTLSVTAGDAGPPRLQPSAAQRRIDEAEEDRRIFRAQHGLKETGPARPSRIARGLRPAAPKAQTLHPGMALRPTDAGALLVPRRHLILHLAVRGRPSHVPVVCSGMVGDTSWVRATAPAAEETRILDAWQSAARVEERGGGRVTLSLDTKKMALYLPR
jgi:hypothetical protein